MANIQSITPEQFGKSYAILESKVASNDEDLARVLSGLPDYTAYLDFRTKFKAGAIGAGYLESGFDTLWSRIMARLAENYDYTIPAKPITTKESAKVSESRKKTNEAIATIAALPEDEIKARLDTLGKAIAEAAAKGVPNTAAVTESGRYFKALEAKRKEASKADNEEAKQYKEALRDMMKAAPLAVLKAMLEAGRIAQQELAKPAEPTKVARVRKAA